MLHMNNNKMPQLKPHRTLYIIPRFTLRDANVYLRKMQKIRVLKKIHPTLSPMWFSKFLSVPAPRCQHMLPCHHTVNA